MQKQNWLYTRKLVWVTVNRVTTLAAGNARDPVTRATWDNYAIISPQLAKTLQHRPADRQSSDQYEVFPKKPVIVLEKGNLKLELLKLVVPGVQENTVAVAVGYGRSNKIGRASCH